MLALLAILLGSPVPAIDASAQDAATPADSEADYIDVLAAVEEGTVTASTDPTSGYTQLQASLAELANYAPLVAVDPHAQHLQMKGQLALARAAIVLGDRESAIEIMDMVLVRLSLAGDINDFPLESVGPRITGLYHERRASLDAGNSARLVIDCPEASAVYVDTRRVSTLLVRSQGVEVTLGEHRIWVEQDGAPAHRRVVGVETPRQRVTVQVPAVAPAPAIVSAPETDPAPAPRLSAAVGPSPRVAPRWIEVPVIVLGVGQMATATAVLAGACGDAPSASSRCTPSTMAIGGVLLTSGATIAALGAAMLIRDEVRARRQRRRASP